MPAPTPASRRRAIPTLTAGLVGAALVLVPASGALADPPLGLVLASPTASGTVPDDDSRSFGQSVSADGRYVVFDSIATDIVPGDTDPVSDIYLRDTVAGTVTWVSQAAGGGPSDGSSVDPVISADGDWIAYSSQASNIAGAAGTPGGWDVFLHERATGTTALVSASAASPGEPGDSDSWEPAISADGRYVAFTSWSSDLLTSAENDGTADIYLRDTVAGTTVQVSVSTADANSDDDDRSPAISADGRYVAFTSFADNLVDGESGPFPVTDVFRRDLTAGQTVRVSVATDGSLGDTPSSSGRGAISGDGDLVVFQSAATGFAPGTHPDSDVFLHVVSTGTTTLVSAATDGTPGDARSITGVISSDGTTVAFSSEATNLDAGDTNGALDVFVRTLATGVTERVSIAVDGTEADGGSFRPALSPDGRLVTFSSSASNLLGGAPVPTEQVYLATRLKPSGGGTSGSDPTLPPTGFAAETAIAVALLGAGLVWAGVVAGGAATRPRVHRGSSVEGVSLDPVRERDAR